MFLVPSVSCCRSAAPGPYNLLAQMYSIFLHPVLSIFVFLGTLSKKSLLIMPDWVCSVRTPGQTLRFNVPPQCFWSYWRESSFPQGEEQGRIYQGVWGKTCTDATTGMQDTTKAEGRYRPLHSPTKAVPLGKSMATRQTHSWK